MSSPGFVVMQANHAVANRTFRVQRVKPPFSQQLYQFYKPYGQTHGRFASFARETARPVFERNSAPVLWHLTQKHLETINCHATVVGV
jgi:hypothetical protein